MGTRFRVLHSYYPKLFDDDDDDYGDDDNTPENCYVIRTQSKMTLS